MGGQVEREQYRVSAENECKITSARRLLGRTTNGDRNQRGTKFHLAPSRRRILIQARIMLWNSPYISDKRDLGAIIQTGIPRLKQRGRVRSTHHGLKIRNIHSYCDSQLVVSQFSGEYEARDEWMDAYLKLVQNLAQEFVCFALTRIPRSENVQAYALAALVSSSDPGLKRVIPVEFIEHPSIRPPIVVNLIEGQDNEEE